MADTRRHLERLLAAHSYNHTRLQSFKCSSLRSHVLPLLLVIVFLSSLSPSLEAEAAGSVRQVVKLGFLLPYPKADHVIPLRLADEWYAPRSRIAASRVALEVLGPKYSNAFDVVPHIAPPTANHSLSLPSSHSLNALVQDRSDSSIKGRSGGARAPEYSDAFDVVPHIALPTANTLYPSHSYHPTCSGLQHQEWLWRIAASRVALEVLAPKYSDAFDVVPHIANSNCDRQEAKEAAQLLLRDGVVGVVGPACTEAALGAADVLVPAGVPIVSFAATWDGFRDRERFGSFFRTVFGDRHQAAAMRSLLQEFVFERVILFFTEDTYGSALGYDIEYFARSDNLAVHSIPVPVPCSNYSSLFLNLSDPSPSKPLIQAGDSTVVVLAVSPNAAGGIWRAALDLPLIQADDSDERLGGAWGCLKATTIVVLAPRGLTQCSRGHLACGSRPGEGYPLQIWSLQYPPHPSTPLLAPPRPSPPLPAPPRPSTPLNAPHSFTRFPILPSPPLRKPPGSVGISVVVFRHGWSSGIRPWWEGQNLSALTSALQGEMGVAPYKGDYSDSSPIWEYIMHWRTKRHDIYPGLLTLDVGPSLPRFNTTRQYVPYLFDAIHAFFEAFSSIIANQSEFLGGWGVGIPPSDEGMTRDFLPFLPPHSPDSTPPVNTCLSWWVGAIPYFVSLPPLPPSPLFNTTRHYVPYVFDAVHAFFEAFSSIIASQSECLGVTTWLPSASKATCLFDAAHSFFEAFSSIITSQSEYLRSGRSTRASSFPSPHSLPRFNTTRQYVPYLFDAVHAFFEAFSSIIATQSECLGGWVWSGVDLGPSLPPLLPPPSLTPSPSLPRLNTTRQYVPYLFDAVHAFFEAFSNIIANQNAAPTKELVLACFKGVLRGCINFTGTTGQVSFNPATGERLKSVAPPTYSIALPPTIPIHPFTTTSYRRAIEICLIQPSYRRAIEICSPTDLQHCPSSHHPHPPLHHNQVSFTPATGERLKSVAPPTYSIALPPTIPIHPHHHQVSFTPATAERLKSVAPTRPHCGFETSQLSSHRPHPSLHHNQVSFNPATGERLKTVTPPTYSIVNLEGVTWQEKARWEERHVERFTLFILLPPMTRRPRWEERHVERFTLDLSQISRPGPLPGAAGAGAGAGGGSGGGTSGGAGNGSAAGVKEAGDYSAPAVFDALNQEGDGSGRKGGDGGDGMVDAGLDDVDTADVGSGDESHHKQVPSSLKLSAKPVNVRSTRAVRIVAMAQPDLKKEIQEKIAAAQETCSDPNSTAECAAAWDEVEEISAAAADQALKQKEADYEDPLEKYCNENPSEDERSSFVQTASLKSSSLTVRSIRSVRIVAMAQPEAKEAEEKKAAEEKAKAEEAAAAAAEKTEEKKEAYTDPLDAFCDDNPAADECRIYED
ncbi:unnamed protein product [Closterium sp. Naga37s-1]|nr:unnamed protein product [Closterium sp. Naga37s-1]